MQVMVVLFLSASLSGQLARLFSLFLSLSIV